MKKTHAISAPATAGPTLARGIGGDTGHAGSDSDVTVARTGCVNQYIP